MTFSTALVMTASAMDSHYGQHWTASTSTSTSTTVCLDPRMLKRKRSRSHFGPSLPIRKRARSCSDITNPVQLYHATYTPLPTSTVTRQYSRYKRMPRTAYLSTQRKDREDDASSLETIQRPKAPLPLRQLKTENPNQAETDRSRLGVLRSRQDGHSVNQGDDVKEAETAVCPADLIMTFDYGVTDGNIAPCFYPGATIPLVIRSTHLVPPTLEPRIRTVLICQLNLPICGEITTLERWHDASTLSHNRQSTLGLTLPLSTGGPASYDTSDGLFGVGWTLYVELYVGDGESRKLVAAFNRPLTILPSTTPTSPILLDPIELHPSAKSELKQNEGGECGITGWTPSPVTMQVGLDASSYSPNSLVPVHLDFTFPPTDLDAPTPADAVKQAAKDESVEVEAKLVRTQQILLRAPGQPDHARTTKHLISHQSTTISPTSSSHDLSFQLTTKHGTWPFGYTAAIRLDDHTLLSNRFVIELTARHGDHVGYCSIPIVIGSVAEPMNAMYIVRGGVISNERGWKVPPPSYGEAVDQPVYTLDTEWA